MQARTVLGVKLKPTEPQAYEFHAREFDYHVRREGNVWVLDEFVAAVPDPNEAHLDSSDHRSLTAAVSWVV